MSLPPAPDITKTITDYLTHINTAYQTYDALMTLSGMLEDMTGREAGCEAIEPTTRPSMEGVSDAELYIHEMGIYVDIPDELRQPLLRALSLTYTWLKPPKPGKYGQIGKLGNWLNEMIRQFFDGRLDSAKFMGALLGVFQRTPLGTVRQVVYLLPYIKLWAGLSFADFVCERYTSSFDTYLGAAMNFVLYVLGIMLYYKERVFQTVVPAMYLSEQELRRRECELEAAIKPMTQAGEAIYECMAELATAICSGLREYYGRWGMRLATYAQRMCEAITEAVLTDPVTAGIFYLRYINSMTSVELGETYRWLATRLNVTPDWVRIWAWWLRRNGQLSYPPYLARRYGWGAGAGGVAPV